MNEKLVSPSVASIDLDAVVEDFADEWRSGRRPGAAEWLSDHPELAANRSIVLDLALEEYHQRQSGGEVIDAAVFCRQFPEHAPAIERLLSMHRLVQENPALFASNRAVAWPALGEVFQGCLLLEELGRGAFSRVYVAREGALGNRLVAVKITQLGSAEAGLLGKLEHPHIVPIYAVKPDEASGLVALIMPYQGHATLADLVDAVAALPDFPADDTILRNLAAARRPKCVDAAVGTRVTKPGRPYVDGVLELAAQLADGLAFMHAEGVYHQDIKPSNVLLDAEGGPKFLDFNLAYDERDAQSKRGGTLPYMPPERLEQLAAGQRNIAGDPDPREDIYALGVILYETLTGRHPFDAHALANQEQSLARMAAAQLELQRRGAPSLCRQFPQVDEGLSRLVQRCLSWKAADRPASAAEVATELRRLAGPVSSGKRLLRRRRTTVAYMAAGFVACLLAGIVWFANRPSLAIREFQRGVAELRADRLASAETHFVAAQQADPDMLDATVGWGLALQRQGKHEEAAKVFMSPLQPDARCYLGAAYCANQRKLLGEAIACYHKANKLGCDTAVLWNNLAYSHLGTSSYGPAIECGTNAIERDAKLPAALYNRAVSYLIEAVATPKGLSPQALADIEQAIEINSAAAEYHLCAARLICLDEHAQADQREQALRHVEQAIELGHNPAQLKTEQFLAPLHGDAKFEQLAARPAPRVPAILPERLIDPLANWQR